MTIKPHTPDDPIAEWRQEDGLYNLSPWVSWKIGEPNVCLDGDFDLDELQAIVTAMKGGTQ